MPFPSLPPLIPRAVLFQQPERQAPIIAPDGRTLAVLRAASGGGFNIWLRPTDSAAERQLTKFAGGGIDGYTWSSDGRRILFLRRDHLWSVEVASGISRDLTPFEGIRAQELLTAERDPGEALVGLNLRDRHVFDMYRIDLETGAVKLDTVNPGDVLSWTADRHLAIRACSAINPEDGSTAVRTRSSGRSPWRTIFKAPFEESLQIAQQPEGGSIVGFNSTGRSLLVVSAKGTDTSRLLKIDASTGRVLKDLTQPYGADIETLPDSLGARRFAVLADPELKQIESVGYNYQKLEWKVIEPSCQADFDAITKFHEGVFRVVSRDSDDRRWVVEYDSDEGPSAYSVYDRDTRHSALLFEDRPELGKYQLAQTHPFAFRARDDQKLIAYITTPVGLVAKGLPLVLYPHPGPWDRSRWGYDPVVQLLANRGYAVLQVNYRGSTGYGTKFLNAANGQWGVGVMQNDLTDAVHWAIAQGIADPKKGRGARRTIRRIRGARRADVHAGSVFLRRGSGRPSRPFLPCGFHARRDEPFESGPRTTNGHPS